MRTITQIEFINYKAFLGSGKENIIHIPKGKSVLIYGENGSGKSTTYEGLKQFFSSVDETNEINPYRNIHCPKTVRINVDLPEEQEVTSNVNVKVTFTDEEGNQDEKLFGVPEENIIGTKYIQTANLLNSFLSYKDLLRTYLMNNSQDNAAFREKFAELLIEQILAKNINSATQKTYIKGWEDLFRPRTWYKADALYKFNAGLNNDISKINLILNEVLKYFDPSLQVKIIFIPFHIDYYYSAKKKRTGNYPVFEIDLKVTLNGVEVDNGEENHLTVLNEARLSALAISIYISALVVTPQENFEYKILFLDDIFIGLDMSNRLPLMEILTKFKKPIIEQFVNEAGVIIERIKETESIKQYDTVPFFNSYQIFLTTYDKYWFELAKSYLAMQWHSIELFVGDNGHPVIKQDNSSLIDNANKYLKIFDYNAAGNCIRRAIEQRLFELVPDTYRIACKDLSETIKKLIEFYEDCCCGDIISIDLRNNLSIFKDIVFNPASHYDLRSPLYKIEIEKAFEVFNILNSIPIVKRYLLIGMRGSLSYKNVQKAYKADFILRENLYAIEIPNLPIRFNDPKHNLSYYQKDGVDFFDPRTTLSKHPDKIQSEKDLVIIFSERIERITRFITPENPITINEFTTADGHTVQTLIDNL